MIDVIFGTEEYKIKEKISKIIAKHEDPDVIRADFTKQPLEELLGDADIPSMFGNKRILIGGNCYFLTGVNKRKDWLEQNVDVLLDYLDKKHDAHLILVVTADSLDGRKKLVKELRKKATITECNPKDQNPVSFVTNKLKENKFKFDSDIPKQIINQVGTDLLVLNSELDKLVIYMGDNKELTTDIIKEVLISNITDVIWDLTDAMFLSDKKKTMELFNNMLELGEEPVKIYNVIASQYRLILEARTLSDAGFTARDIASNLGVHPYRIELALKKSRRYDKATLNMYLEKLYVLGLKYKSGKIDPIIGLTNFLLIQK